MSKFKIDWHKKTIQKINIGKQIDPYYEKWKIISVLEWWFSLIAEFQNKRETISLKLNKDGFNKDWIHKNWTRYTDKGYDVEGYDTYWYDKELYNKSWFNRSGLNREWFDKYWFDKYWIHKNGTLFNEKWFDKNWYYEDWFNATGINQNWFNRKWYNQEGYDKYGHNEFGYDKNWYDKIGFNKDWLNRDGYNKTWFNRLWYNREWYSQNWFDKNWFAKGWVHKNGTRFNNDGFDKNWFDKNGYNSFWTDKYGKNKKQNELAEKLKHYRTIVQAWKWIEWEEFLLQNWIESNDTDVIDIKLKQIDNYTLKYPEIYRNPPSDEQKLFLIDFSPRILLQARAWSWKTTTLVQKTHFLLNECKLKKEEIIFLAFNTSAVEDVNTKFESQRLENAMTFHSLAGRIGWWDDGENVIIEKDEDFTLKNASKHVIQELFQDETIRKFVYQIFRQDKSWEESSPEYEEFINNKWLTSKEYYEIVRWLEYQTLDGEKVKSKAEKWIWDFLFEHWIDYFYEKTVIWGNKKSNESRYSPDFCLRWFHIRPDFIWKTEPEKVWIEFWWIDERDGRKQINPDWDITWEQYKKEMLWKRNYWKEKPDNRLVEFSVADIDYFSSQARELFEQEIKKRLEQNGVICNKISEDKLIKMVIENPKTKLQEMIEQFINKCKQRKWWPTEASTILAKNAIYQHWKIGMFYQFGLKCYQKYQDKLRKTGKKDFNDILISATKKIHQEKWDISIKISKKFQLKVNLKNIKYLMLDEYQDFSQLYYELITAISEYNPDIKIICVGDNWQLINSFAWSQKIFFDKYEDKFFWWKRLDLLKTWRCPHWVVEISNQLMNGLWKWTICGLGHDGKIEWKYIWGWDEDTWIECRKEKEEEYKKDSIYFSDGKWEKRGGAMEKERYIKYSCKIILAWKKKDKNTTFLIMSPFNEAPFKKYELIETYVKILKRDYKTEGLDEKEIYKKLDATITLQTVHKSKWAEADTCILLQVWKKEKTWNTKFPFLHPNYPFWRIFGDTPETILEEQRRLFYVALTRTKKDLYFISESEFSQSSEDFLISSFNQGYNEYIRKTGNF